jgi:hypothetical protein
MKFIMTNFSRNDDDNRNSIFVSFSSHSTSALNLHILSQHFTTSPQRLHAHG